VVVFCQEIYSSSVWYSLQTTMAAEYFVRNQFVPNTLSIPIANERYSYVEGGSFGGIVSNFLALLQPHIYAASGGWTITDYPYASGDMRELDSFQYGVLAMLPPTSHVLGDFSEQFQAVDLLNIRFDSGSSPQWDLAAFAANRRPGDLKVKVYGHARNEDVSFNGFWSLDDVSSGINPKFDGRLRKFMEHGAAWGVVPGKNEYATEKGDEWTSVVQAGAATTAANIDLVPTTAAPSGAKGVWPDPYSHTLRHAATHGASSTSRLQQIDLGPAGYPNQPSSILTRGQGVWPGYRDSIRMVDVDGDGRGEVLFGNMDGFVHDLEIGNDANDPWRLDDQFKSQYLGRQIFASAGYGVGANTRGYFADSRGCVWRLTYNGGFRIDSTPLIQPDAYFVYDGEVPYLYVGNFDGTHGGKEILLLNRFLDWALFDEPTGQSLSNGRLQRNNHDIGPGQACQADVDGDGDLELLVPASDGHVWRVDAGRNGIGAFLGITKPEAFISTVTGGSPRSLYRIDAANFGSGSTPTHFLVFGRNDDLNDSNPSASTSVIMLYGAGTPPTLLAETPSVAGDSFTEAMSFAWIVPPSSSSNTAEFVVSGGSFLQKYTVDVSNNSFACTGTCPIVSFSDVLTNSNAITSIVAPPGSSASYIVVAVSTGRIFVLNSNLQFLRHSVREWASLPDPTIWPSNRSLAQCMTTDFVQESHGADADLYFADYGTAFREVSGDSKYRLGRIHIPIGTAAPSFVPYLSDIKNPAVTDFARGANRTLLYRDLDGDGQREPHVFAETGTAYKDPASNVVREFCTYSYAAPFNYDPYLGDPYIKRLSKGGNVFEYFDPPSGSIYPRYNYLSGFNVPRDSTPFEDFGGNDWWYPRVGANRLSGQISCYSESGLSIGYGDAMKTALIRPDSSTSTPVPHVVVGTNGGCVYAIRPGVQPNPGNACPSVLGYASTCMGSYIIGMDVGDLDGDPDQEIVVGEWMDKGTYVDWLNNNLDTNRAHLHILDPVPPGSGVGTFTQTVLTGDDLLGAGNGIGAGVTGVKIDDVNADGAPDLWCTDAIGHVYLFKHSTSTGIPWSCVYRSQDLGTCPGYYNQIYVMKDLYHKTVKLIVVSTGYVMAFNVDPNI
jgi:hypothetical protein